LFTNGTQVEHLIEMAHEMSAEDRLREGLARAVIASIGPTCSESLEAHDLPVDLEPEHPRMGQLVREAAARGPALLREIADHRRQTTDDRRRTTVGHRPAVVHGPSSVVRGPAPVHQPATPWEASRFMRACRREPVDATPVWLMRQAGRYMKEYRELRGRVSFLELCKNPALVSEVTVSAQERIGADAAILFADILLVVEPLGLQLEYTRGDGPAISPVVR